MATVIVHKVWTITENPGSVLSCFMLEAIQSVAVNMEKKNTPALELQSTPVISF
jgi:hypothetical protein